MGFPFFFYDHFTQLSIRHHERVMNLPDIWCKVLIGISRYSKEVPVKYIALECHKQ